jgi:ATP-dependent Clp protease ATP-binding subunit ClpC
MDSARSEGRRADAGGQTEVGPEHILLAIAREDEGIASQILRDLGADGDAIRAAVGDLS